MREFRDSVLALTTRGSTQQEAVASWTELRVQGVSRGGPCQRVPEPGQALSASGFLRAARARGRKRLGKRLLQTQEGRGAQARRTAGPRGLDLRSPPLHSLGP